MTKSPKEKSDFTLYDEMMENLRLAKKHEKEERQTTQNTRPWYKKKRWWLFCLILFIVVNHYLFVFFDPQLVKYVNNRILANDANFFNRYDKTTIDWEKKGKQGCEVEDYFLSYNYQTCFEVSPPIIYQFPPREKGWKSVVYSLSPTVMQYQWGVINLNLMSGPFRFSVPGHDMKPLMILTHDGELYRVKYQNNFENFKLEKLDQFELKKK